MSKITKYLPYFFIVILSTWLHQNLITFNNINAYDWIFRYPEHLTEIFINTYIIFLPSLPLRFMEYLFGIIGFTSQVSDPLLYFYPQTFLPLLSMYFFGKLYRNGSSIFLFGLIIVGNSYFLSINGVGHNLISIAAYFLYSSILCLFYFLKKLNREIHTRYLLLSVFFLILSGIYDFRVFYLGLILVAIIFFYFTFFGLLQKAKLIKYLLTYFVYSLVSFSPFLVGLIILSERDASASSVLSRSLFEMNLSLLKGFVLMHPYWNSSGIEWFVVQKVPLHFYILLLIPASLLLVLIKNKFNNLEDRKIIPLLILLLVIGLFFSKQISMPFGSLYLVLFKYFPGFNAFREASKFYVIIIFVYAFIAGVLSNFYASNPSRKYSIIYYSIVVAICTLYISNIFLIKINNNDTLYSEAKIPSTQLLFRNRFKEIKYPTRILWVNLPIFYHSSKYESRAIKLSDLKSCNVLSSSLNGNHNLKVYLNINRISLIYADAKVKESCLKKIFGNNLLKTDTLYNVKSYDQSMLDINEFKVIDSTKLISTNINYSLVRFNTLSRYDYDYFFLGIKVQQNSYNIKFEYPITFSNRWIVIADKKVYKPTKSENDLLYWSISANSNLRDKNIYIIHVPTILTRIMVIIPISVLVLLLLLIIRMKYEKPK